MSARRILFLVGACTTRAVILSGGGGVFPSQKSAPWCDRRLRVWGLFGQVDGALRPSTIHRGASTAGRAKVEPSHGKDSCRILHFPLQVRSPLFFLRVFFPRFFVFSLSIFFLL